MSLEVFLARQPILDRDRRTFGYELLYRDGPDAGVFFEDPDDATKNVIQRAMLDWGMERIIGDRFGFINASASLIHTGMHRALPPEGIIIELREQERQSNDVIDALGCARREGYHFALDNVRSLDTLRTSAVLPLVSMVKVEMSATGDRDLEAIVDHLRTNRPGVLLVAEKVESMAQYSRAADIGFDLFEGYYFARPEIMSRAARPSDVASTMNLLAEMQRSDVDVDRVEELVGTDPSLAYRLLAVVNSSAFGLDRRVESLRHAIVLLGIGQVRYLATLLALSTSKDAPEELIALGAMRGRLASALAPTPEVRNGAFTVGLLSVTDALYRTPMETLLADLPVSASIREALIEGTGPYGTIMAIVRACEDADVARLRELAPGRLEQVQELYGEATQWADGLRSQIAPTRSKVTLPRVPGSLAPV